VLPFDPIDEAADQWARRWAGVPQMHAVTSLMRVQQLVLARLDAILRPHGLTFARYEALVLLVFSSRGSLPLGKMGERLQVHPTSVTSIVDRLEAAGLVVRRRHPEDGRAVLAEITDVGRALVERATTDLVGADFGLDALAEVDLRSLSELLRPVRQAAGDYETSSEEAAARALGRNTRTS
jgi:DNA-binding MarR family transcriptional regulator